MPRSIGYRQDLIRFLKDPIEAAMYIEVTIEEGDPQMLRKAIANLSRKAERASSPIAPNCCTSNAIASYRRKKRQNYIECFAEPTVFLARDNGQAKYVKISNSNRFKRAR